MIVVLGRPGVARVRTDAAPGGGSEALHGLAATIAMAAVRAGARVELVGSIGDDPVGDRAAVLLSRSGIGHAALLRDPAGHTSVEGEDVGPPPRLEAADVELGLGYLTDIRVLVMAESLPPDAVAQVVDAAAFQGARLVAIIPAGSDHGAMASGEATILEAPEVEDAAPFAEMVGRYAASLDSGVEPARAFADATAAAGWERSGA